MANNAKCEEVRPCAATLLFPCVESYSDSTLSHDGLNHAQLPCEKNIGINKKLIFYGHPQLTEKRLVRAVQCTQFRAKHAKNDLNPHRFSET
jgi:hypothetical protein